MRKWEACWEFKRSKDLVLAWKGKEWKRNGRTMMSDPRPRNREGLVSPSRFADVKFCLSPHCSTEQIQQRAQSAPYNMPCREFLNPKRPWRSNLLVKSQMSLPNFPSVQFVPLEAEGRLSLRTLQNMTKRITQQRHCTKNTLSGKYLDYFLEDPEYLGRTGMFPSDPSASEQQSKHANVKHKSLLWIVKGGSKT